MADAAGAGGLADGKGALPPDGGLLANGSKPPLLALGAPDGVGALFATGILVPVVDVGAMVVFAAEDAAGGLLFNGLKGSFAFAAGAGVVGAVGTAPTVFCAPGTGGNANGAGSTATGVVGVGGGDASAVDVNNIDTANAAAITDFEYKRIKPLP